jgi:hypothetical protein
MKMLLSDDLWDELKKHTDGLPRLRAAIAYITQPYLNFREGDLLVCDASEEAVMAGQTSPAVLRQFVNSGAEVYSFKGLHSKVAIIGDKALIGSANFSANACRITCEAALLTDDPQEWALINAFVEKVRIGADVRLDDAELQKRELLFKPQRKRGGKRRTRIEVGQSRTWFISTTPLSASVIAADEGILQAGTKVAEKLLKEKGNDVEPLRWKGDSRFRREAKAGDIVVQAHRTSGKDKGVWAIRDSAPTGRDRLHLFLHRGSQTADWDSLEACGEGPRKAWHA